MFQAPQSYYYVLNELSCSTQTLCFITTLQHITPVEPPVQEYHIFAQTRMMLPLNNIHSVQPKVLGKYRGATITKLPFVLHHSPFTSPSSNIHEKVPSAHLPISTVPRDLFLRSHSVDEHLQSLITWMGSGRLFSYTPDTCMALLASQSHKHASLACSRLTLI